MTEDKNQRPSRIEKKGGYTGGKPASGLRPPAPKPRPTGKTDPKKNPSS